MRLSAKFLGCSVALVLAAGCAERPETRGLTMREPDALVEAVARSRAESADAERISLRALEAATRRRELSAYPFLHLSPLGRRFLAMAPPRALALGHPGETCPVGVVAATPRGAVEECLAATAARPDCGCRIVAVDDVALVPSAELAYAPGVGGRLFGHDPALGPLVVEERAATGASSLVAFRSAAGLVAVGELFDDGDATLVLAADGETLGGRREMLGWTRGRIKERLLLTGSGGRRLVALIGFEPDEFVARGPALASWTPPPKPSS
jgi:hypothetical protein